MPSLREIIDVIETAMPLDNQTEYDNSGLIYGEQDKEIKNILLTLDLNLDTLKEAQECHADLIVEHHPSIFNVEQEPDFGNPQDKALYKAVDSGIAVYAAHTSADFADRGLSYYFASKLHVKDVEFFGLEEGRLLVATLEEACSLETLYQQVKSVFGDKHASYIGDGNRTVSKIAIITGGGGGHLDDVKQAERLSDVFISGDIKYHVARWTKDKDYAMINVSHYCSEIIFNDMMAEILAGCGAKIIKAQKCYNPYN